MLNGITDRLLLGCYCPSCYNRAGEFVRGYNARGGGVPFIPVLHRYRIATIYPPARHITFVELTAAHWIEAMRLVVAIGARAGVSTWIVPFLSERIGHPDTVRPVMIDGPAIVTDRLPAAAHRAPPAPVAVAPVGMTRLPPAPAAARALS